MDLRGCGVEGLGVEARDSELWRDVFRSVDGRYSALLEDRGGMRDGDSGSAIGGILGVLRLGLGLPRSCFVLNMKSLQLEMKKK